MDEQTRKRLENFVEKLLHLEDPNNRQVNIFIDENGAPQKSDVYVLYDEKEHFGERLYAHIKNKLGCGVSVYLRDSAAKEENKLTNEGSVFVDWRSLTERDEERSAQRQLSKFIDDIYKEMLAKGMNVLFLSIGSIRWKTPDGVIKSPMLIFPIKLVRKIDYQPVGVEFVDDEIYFNECFYRLFTKIYGEQLEAFPLPTVNGERTTLIDTDGFDIKEFFDEVEKYVENCKRGAEGGTLEFSRDEVALARYTHDDICMYRDITAHGKEIEESKLIRRVFGNELVTDETVGRSELRFVLKYDSVQKEITDKVINGGKCVKVQGPPGTGKTQTIANILACAIAADRKVLFVSKKIPALEEVYAKLPEELRPFVLKIESERENLTVKMSPHDIHREFNRALTYRLPQLNMTGVESTDRQLGKKAREKERELELYCRALFGDELKIGYSLYDAMAAFCETADCPLIRFEAPSALYAVNMDKTVYEDLRRDVINLSENYDVFTDGKRYRPVRSPYFGIKADGIYQDIPSHDKIDELITLRNALQAVIMRFKEAETFDLKSFATVAKVSDADEKFIKKYSGAKELKKLTDCLTAAYVARKKLSDDGLDGEYSYLKYGEYLDKIRVCSVPSVAEEYMLLDISDVKALTEFFTQKMINRVREKRSELKISVFNYDEAMEKYLENREIFTDVMGSGVLDDEKKKKALRKLQSKLAKIKGGVVPKSVYKKLREIRELVTPIADARLTDGARAFYALDDALVNINKERENIGILTESVLTEKTVFLIKTMLELSSGRKTMERVAEELPEILQWIKTSFASVEGSSVGAKIAEGTVQNALRIGLICADYRDYCDKVREADGIKKSIDADYTVRNTGFLSDTEQFIKEIDDCMGVYLASFVAEPEKLIESVKPLSRAIKRAVEIISEFAKANTEEFMGSVSVYHEPYRLTTEDLSIFTEAVGDKRHRDAAHDFKKKTLEKPYLASFFRPFTVGTNEGHRRNTFSDIFKHSFFGLFIESTREIAKRKASLVGIAELIKGDGVSKETAEKIALAAELYGDFVEKFENGDIETIRADFARIDDEIIENNVKLVALKQIERLKTLVSEHKNSFAVFEGEKSKYKNVRLMFKNEAKVIMNVKNCFIVSPSTVSSLMGNGEYKFDIAVFDEASQIEPQYLIPVLFRAKQCVIIGDEHQMPPIKHFVKNGIVGEEDEGEYVKAESGLDLVSAGQGAFDGYSLRCHYRSKSESLIAYSQRYYPDMITFPSKISFNERMGIRDEYVLNVSDEESEKLLSGYDYLTRAGINPTEARKVVEILKEHFRLNPTQTVGVMTFGEAQAQFILKLIGKDSEICERFTGNNDDCFVKPIAKLQGREVDHVIMSMTYGKNCYGKIVNLGDLNRSYGEQIFNVAASRAKYKLTVIHSFTDAEIAASNVSASEYLTEFLRIVKRHSAHGESGFMSTADSGANGFLASVVKFITEECGIDKERVVVNYGATEKSLRIPIVILDRDCKAAETAVFADVPPIVGGRAVRYTDFAVKYRRSLIDTRDWDRRAVINVCDWVNNGEQEREILKKLLINL